MFFFNRKTLTAIGAAAVAVAAATTLFGSPAQAATVGNVEVVSAHSPIVLFTAGSGHQNSVVVTKSGNTVTIDDRVAIKARNGCKAVKGDSTKVTCTITGKHAEVSVTLGDKNDAVYNRSGLAMSAWGDSGNDLINGGSRRDVLHGGSGDDHMYGNASADFILGGSGHDRIYAGAGNDTVWAEDGHDIVWAGAGDDIVKGFAGNDDLRGEAGNDALIGGLGKDRLTATHGGSGVR